MYFTGCVEVVRQLLDRGLDEQHRDNSGWTPLHYAAFEGNMVKLLVFRFLNFVCAFRASRCVRGSVGSRGES